MKHGSPVAFFNVNRIEFGTVEKIVTSEGEKGESKEFHIRTRDNTGSEAIVVVGDEDHILEYGRYPSDYSVAAWMRECPGYEYAKERAETIDKKKHAEVVQQIATANGPAIDEVPL
jgi:hypothetical protein